MEAPFRYESEMYPALGTALHDTIFPSGPKARELREPSICGVIPDVLYCRWRLAPGLRVKKPATIIDAHILSVLEQTGGCGLFDLCDRLYLLKPKANESLSRLLRQGLIVAKRGGTFALAKDASAKRVTLIAIEMKLFRWREALDQAKAYLLFANQSFVVLDGNRVDVSDRVESAFATVGVGLLLQHGASLEMRVRAKSSPPEPTPERFIAMHKASLADDQSPEYSRHFLNALCQTS
jgi:DNA-binding MarR family transcriptional regulator